MAVNNEIPLWEPTFQTFYETYFHELCSEAVIKFWEVINIIAGFLTAITASGSAVAGWTLWSKPGWRMGWATLAGVAVVISIVHSLLQVPRRLKEQGQLRSKFSQLRVDLETFRHMLSVRMKSKIANDTFEELRQRLSHLTSDSHPDIALTKKMRYSVQIRLNSALKEKGYIQ